MQDIPTTNCQITLLIACCFAASPCWADDVKPQIDSTTKTLNVLFVGNSYTARHHLAKLVESMAEAGNPDLDFKPSSVIYGGRRLADHWRLGTQNFVTRHEVTADQIQGTIDKLTDTAASDPDDSHARNALKKQAELLKSLESNRGKWDIVVLQSYRDDLDDHEAKPSLYAQYAPKFAALAQAQGARVVLYETSPTTQNAQPLTTKPDAEVVMKKERSIAALADRIDAAVAPMALVGHRCQSERPDLTLRFVNDAHLSQTMAYLSACSIYAAIFGKSPVGLPVDSVTDIRYWQNDDQTYDRAKDRDGKPITCHFSDTDRGDLQRIAWEGFSEFEKLRGK